MTLPRCFALLLLAMATPVPGAETPPAAAPPALSPAQRKRVQENLATLEKNLADAKENLTTIQTNQKAVQAELADLETLEKEHLELKRRHEDYVGRSRGELDKNAVMLRKLDDEEKALTASPGTPESKGKLEALRRDRDERKKWQDTAQAKATKADSVLLDILKNLREIQSRKAALPGQVKSWQDRQSEYDRLIRELGQKKAALETAAPPQ